MFSAGKIILWLHLTAVVLWIGGTFAMTLAFIPLTRHALTAQEDAGRLIVAAVNRWQRISRELITIVLLTGIFNVIFAGLARAFAFGAEYIAMLLTKILLFALMVIIQLWQTHRLVPRYAAAISAGGNTTDASNAGRRLATISVLVLVLAATAVFLGLGLRFR